MFYKLTLMACLCALYSPLMFGSETLRHMFGFTKKVGYQQVHPRERSPLDTDPFEDQLPDSVFSFDSAPDSDLDLATHHGFSGGESSDSADSAKQRAAAKGPNQPTMQDKEDVNDDDAAAVRAVTNGRLRSKASQECCLCNAWMCTHGALERNK